MPIKSYLAFSKPGELDRMVAELEQKQLGEVQVAENRQVAVLVTDTPDAGAEKMLEQKLENIQSIQCLALVYGHSIGEADAC